MSTPTQPAPESAWIERSDRVRVEVAGPDRAKFLHNLVTNDVKKLKPGQGCEAFVTSPQGKTLAYVTLVASETSILVRSEPGQLDSFLGHFQKYGVFDDIAIEDVAGRTFEVHIWGDAARAVSEAMGFDVPGDEPLANLGSVTFSAIRESPTGHPGLTLIGPVEGRDALLAQVAEAAGTGPADPAAFEALRIGAGTPASGRDVTPSNLPQEVGRDRVAISFVKGCYLGQETVARLDALGHVNKILKGLRIPGDRIPAPGAALTTAEGKPAGTVTSAAVAAGGGVVALGYVRVAQAEPGTAVQVDVAGVSTPAEVADLPMGPG